MAKKLMRITIDIESKYDNYLDKIKKLIQEHMEEHEGKDIGIYLYDIANHIFSANASYEVFEDRPEEKEIIEYSQGWYEEDWGNAFIGLDNALMDKLILHVDKNKDKYEYQCPELSEEDQKELQDWWHGVCEKRRKEISEAVENA